MNLQESIRRILKEESLKKTLIQMIQEDGIETTGDLVDGIENLLEILKVYSPMDFLHLFNDLEIVKDQRYPNLILFKNKSKHNIMIYRIKQEEVFIHIELVWFVLKNYFGLKYHEIQDLTKEWLSDIYDIKAVDSQSGSRDFMESL